MTKRTPGFPVLLDHWERQELPEDVPRHVPWGFVEPHERRAMKNHGQTLKRLSERGGLGLAELHCLVTNTDLRGVFSGRMTEAEAWKLLRPLLDAFLAEAEQRNVP